jgi:hypothetical protein
MRSFHRSLEQGLDQTRVMTIATGCETELAPFSLEVLAAKEGYSDTRHITEKYIDTYAAIGRWVRERERERERKSKSSPGGISMYAVRPQETH